MHHRTRTGITIAMAAIALWAVYACSPQADQNVYRIGVIGPLTGEGASYGEAMKQGIDMAIDQVNVGGGVNGRHLEALYEDDRLTPKDGIAAFNKLVTTAGVPVIIGSAASRVTLSIAPMAQERHVVLFSSISTADELKKAGDYIFRDVPTNSMQGKTAAAFVSSQLHAPNVAILYKNDDYGSNLAASFRADLGQMKIPIVFDEGYDPIQRDFRSVLSRLQSTKPAVVFFPGNYQDNALILKQAREGGLTVPFVGGDGAFSDELFKIAGDASENCYVTMMGIPKSQVVDAFLAQFAKRYNSKEPNVFVYYAYDALMIVAEAIKQGGYTADGIKNALRTIDYNGLTGETHFDSTGGVNKPFSIYKANKGHFEVLDWRPDFSS
jgi:branched-chain amino acid transport system substrate-binding protein